MLRPRRTEKQSVAKMKAVVVVGKRKARRAHESSASRQHAFVTSTVMIAFKHDKCFEFPCGSLPSKASVSDAKPIRCYSCRRRVGLTGFKCRCGNSFCSVHRYSEEHNCTFDYKAKAKKEIAANNPVVKAPKIHKI
ncbi:hypothetical protein KP509_1Z062000 [Ceratopteris richardii]|nr:hypothetical protein KP509_1Z062000 [Ceratopteris richardii]